jgi:hypothetical protein
MNIEFSEMVAKILEYDERNAKGLTTEEEDEDIIVVMEEMAKISGVPFEFIAERSGFEGTETPESLRVEFVETKG